MKLLHSKNRKGPHKNKKNTFVSRPVGFAAREKKRREGNECALNQHLLLRREESFECIHGMKKVECLSLSTGELVSRNFLKPCPHLSKKIFRELGKFGKKYLREIMRFVQEGNPISENIIPEEKQPKMANKCFLCPGKEQERNLFQCTYVVTAKDKLQRSLCCGLF